nr:type I secretion C-terminal target domain-containing protein [Stutzerimonas chloritidismutans]
MTISVEASDGTRTGSDSDVSSITRVNDAPFGSDWTLNLAEDGSRTFSTTDFGFTDADAGDSLQAVRIDALPTAGSLTFNGTSVATGQVIAVADLGKLTYTPVHDDSSNSTYATMKFSVGDHAGVFSSAPNTLLINVSPVADVPDVSISVGTASTTQTTITTSNVTTGAGFAVIAIAADRSHGLISTNGSPVGFGVQGNSSNGSANELGGAERLIVAFDAPVASATVQLAWLNSSEGAAYTLYDSNNVDIGGGTISGGSDGIDPGITLTSTNGSAISRIEFSAPGDGDDYLIHSITFASSTSYPLTIVAAPTDIDHSESIARVTLKLPAGATLSVGSANPDGTWSVPLAGDGTYSVSVDATTHAVTVSGLTMNLPGSPTGSLEITATAVAQDGSSTASASTHITIGDTTAPVTSDVTASGLEDNAVTVTLSATDTGSSIANFTVTSLPANGTLSFNSQPVVVGQTIPAVGNQATISFMPDANWNGSTAFQYRASDAAGNLDQSPATVSIQVSAVNDAPVNQLPSGYTMEEDGSLKLSGLSITDVDVATGLISVTLGVASGTLSAADAGGVTVSGSGNASLVLSGTLSEINAYLADAASQPVYTPLADASGPVTLTMTSSDGGNTGSGGALSDSDSIAITINPVADAVPGSDVSVVIGTPVVNAISFISDGGLTGKSEYTFANGVTISASTGTFHWSKGNSLGVDGTIIKKGEVVSETGDDEQRIEGSDETIVFTFPYGIQYMDLRLKNSSDDSVLIRSKLEVGDLTDGTIAGVITSSSGQSISSNNLKVELELLLQVDNGGATSAVTVTRQADVAQDGSGDWSVDYSDLSGTLLSATVNSYVDGSLFNQGGNGDAGLHYSIDTDMTQLSIGQDSENLYQENNNGFQIEYIAVGANPSGLNSYSYPIDIYALVKDQVGTAETFTGLTLSDLPDGAIISVAHADGSYLEIVPDAQGVYDLSAHTDLLTSPTTTSGTDKIYLITDDPLPYGYAPSLAIQVSDGGVSNAWTILGGSDSSTHSGGAGDDNLLGNVGNDILIGGEGDDILLGGSGADTFTWKAGDSGHDNIADFNTAEGDRIDLRDLLVGETDGNIDNYLQLVTSPEGASTLLISSTGNLNAVGGATANADTSIEMMGVNLSSSSISSLIAGTDPIVKVDH